MSAPEIDRFLSEEDLDLRNMSWEELLAWWNLWLEQSQVTNELDWNEYAHGVFRHGPRTGDGGQTTADRRRKKQTSNALLRTSNVQ